MDKQSEALKSSTPAATGGVSAARELFKNKTARGQDIKEDADTLKTRHERTITLLRDATPGGSSGGSVQVVSSSSLDGKLILWTLPKLEIDMAALGI